MSWGTFKARLMWWRRRRNSVPALCIQVPITWLQGGSQTQYALSTITLGPNSQAKLPQVSIQTVLLSGEAGTPDSTSPTPRPTLSQQDYPWGELRSSWLRSLSPPTPGSSTSEDPDGPS